MVILKYISAFVIVTLLGSLAGYLTVNSEWFRIACTVFICVISFALIIPHFICRLLKL